MRAPRVVLDPKRTGSLFDNSIPIANMHALEWLAYYIDPPRWPEAVFGAIKPDLAAAGEGIFAEPAPDATSMATISAPRPA